MVHFRSPSWLIPAASHDGFSTDVHHHGSFTTAARGGLTPAPACRCRRTYLHLCNSMVAVDHSVFYIRTTQLPSGHTNAVAEVHHFASRSYEWIVEGDIKACFDEISHSALLDR